MLGSAIKQTEARLAEIAAMKDLLSDEIEKTVTMKMPDPCSRTFVSLIAPLAISQSHDIQVRESVMCVANLQRRTRILFSVAGFNSKGRKLQSELEETDQLLLQLGQDRTTKRNRHRHLSEQLAELDNAIQPIRQAAAAVLPPELFLLDVRYGRIQERLQQLGRVQGVLDQRQILANEIQQIQTEIADAESAIETKASGRRF